MMLDWYVISDEYFLIVKKKEIKCKVWYKMRKMYV